MGEQTSERVLKDCPEYRELSQKYWPGEMTLNHKLYGTKEEP